MSRQHVMTIADHSATAFLFGGSDRRWNAGTRIVRVRSKRGGAASRSRRPPTGRIAGPWSAPGTLAPL